MFPSSASPTVSDTKARWSIFSGVIAAWMFCASDYLLDMRSMFGEGFYSVFVAMNYGTALYAAVVMLAFPFLALVISLILRLSSLSWLVPFTWFFLLTVPMAIHTSFMYYYLVVNEVGTTGEGARLLAAFDQFKNPFGLAYFAGVAFLSACLFIAIAAGKSVFPRYFALINPLIGVLALRLIATLSPTFAEAVHAALVPASMLAAMVTVCGIYLLRHRSWRQLGKDSSPR